MQRVIAALTICDGTDASIGRLALLRKTGIEYVELMLDDSFAEDEVAGRALESLRDALEWTGLRVSSCHLGSGTPLEPETVEKLDKKLDAAHRLEANRVVAQAGSAENDQEFRRILVHLRRLADRAAAHGITIALDTQPGLMQNWRSMRATIEELDHPQLRINFDPGNLIFYNHKADDETSLARIAHLVAHVHLHDTVGFAERAYGSLGHGTVNFFRLRETLDVCGFQGPYSLILDQDPDRPESSEGEYIEQIQKSLENLRWCGFLA